MKSVEMDKEVTPEIIKTTQNSLGKHITRPQLTEKLLKKPPFRFLHDIITAVLKTSGFFEGLFEDEELVSDNVKDRDSKILFLQKTISVLSIVTGKSLTAKPSKIVAGQEPEKTNELLQCLAFALDNKLNSDDAVRKFKQGVKSKATTEKNEKMFQKTEKKKEDTKNLTSKSSNKLITEKREQNVSSTREKDKTNINKTKGKDIKKDTMSKKSQLSSVSKNTVKKSIEKLPVTQAQNVENKIDREQLQSTDIFYCKDNIKLNEKTSSIDSKLQDNVKNEINLCEDEVVSTSNKMNENDLNSFLSSSDVMEITRSKIDATNVEDFETKNVAVMNIDEKVETHKNEQSDIKSDLSLKNHGNSEIKNNIVDIEDKQSINDDGEKIIQDHQPNIVRSSNVRPPSTRPGAPRLREKHDNVSSTDNLLIGKVNIISESASNIEEEDSSIIIMDQQTLSIINDQQEQTNLSENQHSHLVQQILDSQKEFSQSSGKTEIEWQFGAQKSREALNQEMDELRFNIQAMSRVANPLGKLLDHIQEDAEVMRQELLQWTKTYEDTSKELAKLKSANEDSFLPLHAKLKQIDEDINDKHEKINDLKIIIHRNNSRIERLLASGSV